MALPAQFTVSSAIAGPLLAQLFFVEAGLPQLSTPCSSAVTITAIPIIVMTITGADIDTPRPNLNAHLRECYSWENKEKSSKDAQDVCTHLIVSSVFYAFFSRRTDLNFPTFF
jgi:hypothetical protein